MTEKSSNPEVRFFFDRIIGLAHPDPSDVIRRSNSLENRRYGCKRTPVQEGLWHMRDTRELCEPQRDWRLGRRRQGRGHPAAPAAAERHRRQHIQSHSRHQPSCVCAAGRLLAAVRGRRTSATLGNDGRGHKVECCLIGSIVACLLCDRRTAHQQSIAQSDGRSALARSRIAIEPSQGARGGSKCWRNRRYRRFSLAWPSGRVSSYDASAERHPKGHAVVLGRSRPVLVNGGKEWVGPIHR